MVSLASRVDAVKADLTTASASTTTVSALQGLLIIERLSKSATVHTKPNSRATATRHATKTRKPAGQQPVQVLEDAAETLSPRAAYALATEVVNITLKVLTTAAKSRTSAPLDAHSGDPAGEVLSSIAQTQRRTSIASPRPLQSRSINSSPVSSRPGRTSKQTRLASEALPSTGIQATTECARLAFSYLRSPAAQIFTPKTQSRWQLETGMLALAGRLVTLGLASQAVKELRVLKRRLHANVLASRAASQAMKISPPTDAERETMASLLHIELSSEDDFEALGLAISAQLLILKIIAASRKPSAIEATLEYLRPDQTGSLLFLMLQQATMPSAKAKSAKQLEVMAQTVLSFCPSASPSQDAAAVDTSQYASPMAVFELQTLALRVRQIWWKLAGHQADIDKELVEPFLRCINAFMRRLWTSSCGAGAYNMVAGAYGQLDIDSVSCNIDLRFEINKLLAAFAERCGKMNEALRWVEQMERTCVTLNLQHARRVACLVRRYTINRLDDSTAKMSPLSERLRGHPTGCTADYDILLSELARHVVQQRSHKGGASPEVQGDIVYASASFAQRYARSYPGRSTSLVQLIVQAALRQSRTSDDMQKWVTRDAARLYMHCGALLTVANAAACKPMAEAWTGSAEAIALDKILQAVILQHLKRCLVDEAALVIDDDTLPPEQRGALVEEQLCHALDLLSRSKYRAALQKLIPDLLRRLSKLYTSVDFPLRRARIATIALCLRESHQAMLPPHAVKVWLDVGDVTGNTMGKDVGLKCFASDITAGWTVARSLYDGKPTMASLEPILDAWQHIVDTAASHKELIALIYDTKTTSTQLSAIAMYAGVLGNDRTRLRVLCVLLRLAQLSASGSDSECTISVELSRQYIEMGYAEKAGIVLAEAQAIATNDQVSTLTLLQLSISNAEYHVAVDKLESAHVALEQAKGLRTSMKPESIAREERRAYELLHARAWLVQSKLSIATGHPKDALATAKRAVRLLNGTWAALENASEGRESGMLALPKAPEAAEVDINALSLGISKLQLNPKGPSHSNSTIHLSEKGASFWAVLPLSCRAMMHLSDIYAHHGLFGEGSYYSERAVSMAETVQSTVLLARVLSHRCRLMTLAGRLEDAELCLTRSEDLLLTGELSIARLDSLTAKAALRAKEESFEEALQCCQQAADIFEKLSNEAGIQLQKPATVEASGTATAGSDTAPAARLAKKGRKTVTASSAAAIVPSTKRVPKRTATSSSKATEPVVAQLYLLDKMQAQLTVECAIMCLQAGEDTQTAFGDAALRFPQAMHEQHLDHHLLMRNVAYAVQSDVSYNSLPESSLSFPAFVRTDSSKHPSCLFAAGSGKILAPSKAGSRKCTSDDQVDNLLLKARECLTASHLPPSRPCSTADMHLKSALLLKVNMLLAAVGKAQAQPLLHPVREAVHIEWPKINALQSEAAAIDIDSGRAEDASPLMWPDVVQTPTLPPMSAAYFQQQYVEILPRPWTAVSICLNDDGSELYVARYRSGQSPLILRLPFSRHKSEGSDDEAFDYHTGKAELQDIIQVSNYSCHNSGSVTGKGAKSNWWAEREALDRRLHELLVNIENIWFGGFKGVLSQQARQPELLARFRKSFDDILNRYLPSRQSAKGRGKLLALDSKVLELFVGLGSDQDGVLDLDEPLSDLLYFVVDMLQFAGERNAYDEIDFDGMTVDVLDALRSYHEAIPDQAQDTPHLILILDKRLQGFPWESLPYLEGSSVSRVNSMLGLKERILIMRRQVAASGHLVENVDRYIVNHKSGTYILNPSKDLASTQTTLAPSLLALGTAEGAQWTSRVQQAPDEDEFRTALTISSMLLYFGHGAGSQYIRPRSIRKLDKCSEVVWLMGCSSGAVTEYGELEPSAVPFAYLMAGGRESTMQDAEDLQANARENTKCMAVVATLWDVTDKDIDRFSLAMGEEWGLWPASEASKLPAKTPKKRDRLVAPSTPQQVPKTPKTPKACKTPGPATKTPARSRSRSQLERDAGKKRSLVEAVARSRDACYLRYLNGAAPVVYGVPVYIGD